MNLNQIFTGIILILFLGMGGYIIYLQYQVNQTLADQKEEIYNMIDQKLTGIDQKMITLNSGIDSLNLQYDSLKTAQHEILRTNLQAKEQVDSTLSAYRDIVLTLPRF